MNESLRGDMDRVVNDSHHRSYVKNESLEHSREEGKNSEENHKLEKNPFRVSNKYIIDRKSVV